MKQLGIKGKANGLRNGKKIYRSLKLEPSHREAVSITRNEYKNTESLFFNNETLDQIMEKKDFVDESLYVFEINRKMHMN